MFPLSPETISLFCMLIVFSIEHHLKPIHHHRFASSINDLSVHPKSSNPPSNRSLRPRFFPQLSKQRSLLHLPPHHASSHLLRLRMLSALISGQKRHYEEFKRIFVNNWKQNQWLVLVGKIRKEIAANEGSTVWRDRKSRMESCIARKKSARKSTL